MSEKALEDTDIERLRRMGVLEAVAAFRVSSDMLKLYRLQSVAAAGGGVLKVTAWGFSKVRTNDTFGGYRCDRTQVNC